MRSVRARMLAVSLLVALVAVAVTAWVANRETAREVRAAVEQEAEAQEAIYEELSAFALANGSWEDVGPLVASLADRYDERVALTDLDGGPIADSASGEEDGLPAAPAGFIDPGSPVISFEDPPRMDLLPILGEFAVEAEGLIAALEDAGVPFTLSEADFGITFPVWDETDPQAAIAVDDFYRSWYGAISGGDVVVSTEPEMIAAWTELLAGFLDEQGIDAGVHIDELGLPFVEWGMIDPHLLEEFFAEPGVLGPEEFFPFGGFEAADPALLFLGYAGEDEAVPSPFGWRLLLTVAAVALLAVAVTVLASRRLLGPVGDLTAAARRMESGELGERVAVRGSDEIAVLAGAFNAMAASLEDQDRARRTLTGDIAHELRTPLSNIRGYLEAIREGVAEASPEVIASVHEESIHLQGLIDDLQELALAEAGALRLDPVPTDLAPVVEGVVQAHRARAEAAGISLAAAAGVGITAEIDPARMRQVLANLIDNALRHTPPGGAVRVLLERHGDRAQIRVEDDGPGITPEHLPHLFERFYRADPSRSRETGGSGLGLAIAAELVRAHEGTIAADPLAAKGAAFVISLPLAGST